jgi:hypothetical protein
VAINLGFFNIPHFNAISPRLPATPMELNGRISVRWRGTLTADKDRYRRDPLFLPHPPPRVLEYYARILRAGPESAAREASDVQGAFPPADRLG